MKLRLMLLTLLTLGLFSCTKQTSTGASAVTIPSGEVTTQFYTQEEVVVTVTYLPSGVQQIPQIIPVPFVVWPQTTLNIPPGTTQVKLDFICPVHRTVYTTNPGKIYF